MTTTAINTAAATVNASAAKAKKGRNTKSKVKQAEKAQEVKQELRLTVRSVLIESVQVEPELANVKLAIEVSQAELTDLRNGVADHLMIASRHFKIDHAAFDMHCKNETSWLKSPEGAQACKTKEVKKVPRSFIQAKSDIIAGMKLGLNPQDFSTYSLFKKAKVELNKASKKAEEKAEVEASVNGEPVAKGDSPLSLSVSNLIKLLHTIPEVEHGKAASYIDGIMADLQVLATLVPNEPIHTEGETVEGEILASNIS